MTPVNHEGQLELFDVAQQPAPRPHRDTWGRVWLQLRYDQLVLAAIGGLLSIAVIFACGVERGKQLVRSERTLLARQEPASADDGTRSRAPAVKQAEESSTEAVTPPAKAASPAKPSPAPSVTPKKKEPKRVASSGSSRYAIQVVTFSHPQLAKQELDRLRAKGEPAFLVMRNGRTIVYVGPYTSKSNASEQLARLRTKYQDCFLKTL